MEVRAYYEAKEDETLCYYDVRSLYPYVQKYKEFMIGHPNRILHSFGDISTAHLRYKGLIKCRILCPKKLFLPLLPYKTRGKLMFVLCSMCADTANQKSCQHTDFERSYVGTFTTVELEYAVSKLDYKIMKIYEIFHWDTWSCDLFKKFVDTFEQYIPADYFKKLCQMLVLEHQHQGHASNIAI